MTYAFILGKNTALSVAEIISVLKRDLFVFVVLSISTDALIINTEKEIKEAKNFLDRLGGTIKIVGILTEIAEKNIESIILNNIKKMSRGSKFVFGISLYGLKNKNLGLEIKKELKKSKISSRFIYGKKEFLSAPEIKNNKVLEKGADFVLIRNKNKIFLGKTLAIQNYEAYSDRDYERPRRNAKSGMLPPKLAQIMINIIPSEPKKLQATSYKLIYDPFCGQGTILQEAILMGYQTIGSDLSRDRVYDAKENLKWLKNRYNLNINPEKNIFQADALKLKKENLQLKPDAVVSELYLGPPLSDKTTEQQILMIKKDLEKKYLSFLNNIGNLGIQYFILALPFYKIKNKVYHLNIFDEISSIGYNTIDPLEKSDIDFELLPEYSQKRKTILYSRPDQIVGREIIILERK